MITLHSNIIEDEYTEYIRNTYDLDPQKANSVSVPSLVLPKAWNIIAVIGASGSGKSTILNQLGGAQEAHFDERPVISNLGLPPKEAAELLCAIGLASVPSWCRPLNNLSNGEQYRAKLAQVIANNDLAIVDEFTSVIDRNSALAMSNALQKYIRRNNKRIILASCHYDIIPFLKPDYIFDLNKGGVLERGDCLPRPAIPLRLYRVEPNTWRIFAKHHYMSAALNEAAACFVAQWDDKPVAFCAVLPLPSGTIKNAVRATRSVVLPDYQGLGIGSKLTDTIAGIYKAAGKDFYTKTINPALGLHREHSPLWEPSAKNHRYQKNNESYIDSNGRKYLSRPSFCHHYIGPAIYGFENLVLPIDTIRRERSLQGQLSLF